MIADSLANEKNLKQKDPHFTLSLPALVSSSALILLNLSAFNWLPWLFAVVYQLPPLLLIISLSWVLEEILAWHGLPRPWRTEIGRKGVKRYILTMAFLIAAGPAVACARGILITHNFIDGFDIEVKVESREFVLLEPPGLAGQQRPFRGVTTIYDLLEPVDDVEAKMRNRLQNERGWLLSNDRYFWGSCDRDSVGKYITIFLASDDALHVAIHYGVPSYCLLN